MREPCPRCGAERSHPGACPECGYERPHPGVLGAYREALGQLAGDPRLVVPFLLPTVLLVGLRALAYAGGDVGQQGDVVEGLAGVLVLYLGLGWYLAAVGSITPPQQGPRVPEGPVFVSSATGAGFVAAPLAAFVLLVGLQGPEDLGAFAMIASILLLLGALVAAGRAVGMPVEAALARRWDRTVLAHGNERGREHGGLGTVFLALLMLVPLAILPNLAGLLVAEPWAGWGQLVLTVLGLVLVGAWTGTAIAIGLGEAGPGVEETFTCPRCGGQARAREGRAVCECGLEGPFYPGSQAGA